MEQKEDDQEIGEIVTESREDLVNAKKIFFNLLRWNAQDYEKKFAKSQQIWKEFWDTPEPIKGRCFREPGDQISTALKASVASKEAALNVIFTVSANYALRNKQNSFEYGKAIAAGHVGLNEVVSKDVLKTLKEVRSIRFRKLAPQAEQVEYLTLPLKMIFMSRRYYQNYNQRDMSETKTSNQNEEKTRRTESKTLQTRKRIIRDKY
ncbi:MAG: hypothetical protein EZS28_012394 [Streblomastix strix]|uniref:Uncharacterized protein n=1 Tax=Streblomastix strix TaxID=222440 RepID=A0A5J4WBN2_9EUKA|nr:MAG: hypothetical protein EZS28_012394 [Streblomastix strix]